MLVVSSQHSACRRTNQKRQLARMFARKNFEQSHWLPSKATSAFSAIGRTFFSSILNKKIQRSDWLVSTMKGEKIITQPWWCQSWRNFIWIFWRLIGQLDAWNWNHLDNIWCKIYAKQNELHLSSNFQNSSF